MSLYQQCQQGNAMHSNVQGLLHLEPSKVCGPSLLPLPINHQSTRTKLQPMQVEWLGGCSSYNLCLPATEAWACMHCNPTTPSPSIQSWASHTWRHDLIKECQASMPRHQVPRQTNLGWPPCATLATTFQRNEQVTSPRAPPMLGAMVQNSFLAQVPQGFLAYSHFLVVVVGVVPSTPPSFLGFLL